MEYRIKDLSIYYETYGEGRPIIVIHGWGMDHRYMVSDMEPLFKQRDGWRRIYLDLPGHGRTPGKDWIVNQDRMLDVVLGFIDKVIPEQRFSIVGSSAGAYLARGVVHQRLASIDGVLLTVPLVRPSDGKRQVNRPAHVTLKSDTVLISEVKPVQVDDMFGIVVVQSRKILDYLQANVPSPETGDEAFTSKIRDFPEKYAFSFNVDALPKPCNAPTLIVTGRQDSLVGYRDAWELIENYPRGSFVVLDRSGHFLGTEQQNLFHALAGEWLDRVKEYIKLNGGM